MSDDLRYPIGPFKPTPAPTVADRREWIKAIEEAPGLLRAAVKGLTDRQLDTPYRDGGWTVRQVVHHVPDSHMNAYIRTCLALTENDPTIRPYDENAWSNLTFARLGPIDISLALLDALHARWLGVLRSMSEADYSRRLFHPANDTLMTTSVLIEQYAWHGRHHIAHVERLKQREGWA